MIIYQYRGQRYLERPQPTQLVVWSTAQREPDPIERIEIPDPEPSEGVVRVCLSLWQPWAWLVANGIKDIENRSWPTPYRGKLWIHAGLRYDEDGAAKLPRKFLHRGQTIRMPDREDFQHGGLVGFTRVLGCRMITPNEASPWAMGPHLWELDTTAARVIPFEKMRGYQRLFRV